MTVGRRQIRAVRTVEAGSKRERWCTDAATLSVAMLLQPSCEDGLTEAAGLAVAVTCFKVLLPRQPFIRSMLLLPMQ